MFCPKCKVGYEIGFYKCADCGDGLVEKLSEKLSPEEPDAHIQEVFRTSDAHEANLIKGLLESNNIKVFSNNENFSGINTFYAISAGGIKIGVNEYQLSNATDILNEYRAKNGEDPHHGGNSPFIGSFDEKNDAPPQVMAEAGSGPTCPKCGCGYNLDISECADCHVPLVNVPPHK